MKVTNGKIYVQDLQVLQKHWAKQYRIMTKALAKELGYDDTYIGAGGDLYGTNQKTGITEVIKSLDTET